MYFCGVVGKRKFGTVLAASFTSSYSIRWVHISIQNNVFHSATVFVRNNIVQKIVLYKNSPKAIQGIQKVEVMFPNTKSIMDPRMFINCPPSNIIKKPKFFLQHVEENAPYHFLELKQRGARVEHFNRETDKNFDVKYIQAEPDINFNDGDHPILFWRIKIRIIRE
jgi:hypothetical protein